MQELDDNISRAKCDFEHLADLIKMRFGHEDQVIQRVEQVQAAIQRLEWALERTQDPSMSSPPATD